MWIQHALISGLQKYIAFRGEADYVHRLQLVGLAVDKGEAVQEASVGAVGVSDVVVVAFLGDFGVVAADCSGVDDGIISLGSAYSEYVFVDDEIILVAVAVVY